MPGGLPIPELKLPKRQPKNSKQESKVTVAAVEGTLRKVREKDLLLQTRRGVLRFRLLAKTMFLNKAGEPMRDSLFKPGDQVSVQVNPDDEETAIRVVRLKEGSAAERAASEPAVDEASILSPRAEDLSKPRTVSSPAATPIETGAEADSTTPVPVAVGDPGTPEPSTVGGGAPRSNSDTDIIADARAAAATYSSTLPNYLAQQVTRRYFKSTGSDWQMIDTVTAELAYTNGKEEYRDIQIDGRPADRPPDRSGAWTTGEFGSTLEDLLSTETNASFKKRGEAQMGGRTAVVYDFKVAQANSHWTLISVDQRKFNAPYEGAMWVDKETRRVLRIEQRTTNMPADFSVAKAECILNYGYARVDQKTYLLPASGENIGCLTSGTCTRNAIEFRSYRKFAAQSQVKF